MIETFPNVAILYNILVLAKAGLAQYDAAITCYRRALELDPGFFEALSNIGAALKQKGDLDGAIDSFKQALKIKPDQVVLYRHIGKAQIERGRLIRRLKRCKRLCGSGRILVNSILFWGQLFWVKTIGNLR